jgi:hypothetical protein
MLSSCSKTILWSNSSNFRSVILALCPNSPKAWGLGSQFVQLMCKKHLQAVDPTTKLNLDCL